jgi:hypothetical protein
MARFTRFAGAALLVAGAVLNVPAIACEPLAPNAPSVAGTTTKDAAGRAIALVRINGQGPFRFIIDTGANRSVLSQALATRLGLVSSGEGVVHSIDGTHPATLVNVESLSIGTLRLSHGDTPVLDGPMLDGAHGLLGVDGMAGRLLHIDFTKRCVEIYESAAQMPMKGWQSAPARMRFGLAAIPTVPAAESVVIFKTSSGQPVRPARGHRLHHHRDSSVVQSCFPLERGPDGEHAGACGHHDAARLHQ